MPQLIIFLIIALIIGIITIVILANDLSYRKSELEKNRIYECELRGEINESKRILQTQTSLKSRENNLLKEKISSLNKCLEKNNKENQERITDLSECISKKDILYDKLKTKNNESHEYISNLMSDFLTLEYDTSATYLETKRNPAKKEALRIRELKTKAKENAYNNKLLEYKYAYLLELFPDLDLYVDSLDSIQELKKFDQLNDLRDAVDNTRYFLSKEEYLELQEDKKNQLALDRYIESRKSNWQIGRDYEMFIGYEYSKSNWNIDYFGIEKKLEDMGRDLIAIKGNNIHIVQCKYWSRKKLIHEKHIAQLYGTTIQYKLASATAKNVIPVFVTNISLSDTAVEFAKYLGVRVSEKKGMDIFPRIKCNIGTNAFGEKTKIYHLPMDQQYDNIKMSGKDKFFALTVKDAVDRGYRRAWKWYNT